jgi:hypothetical protein
MPIFIGRNICGCNILLKPDDPHRKFFRKLLFYDYFPYLSGSLVSFKVDIIPTPAVNNQLIGFDWRLCFPSQSKLIKGKIDFSINSLKKQTKKIVTDYLFDIGTYYLEMKCSNDPKSEFVKVAEFELQRRDRFYRDTMIPNIASLLITIFAALIGIILGIGATLLTQWLLSIRGG